jgi:hypothetical protein
MELAFNRCLYLNGRSGSGKTLLLRALLEAAPAAQTLIVFDVQAEYGDLCHYSVRSVRELTARALEIFGAPGRRVQLLPDPAAREDEELTALCRLLETLRCTTLVLDDADIYLQEKRTVAYEPLLRVVRVGRHHGTAIWAAGHRPADIPKSFLAGAQLISERPTLPGDLDFFQAIYGALPWGELKPHEFLFVPLAGVRPGVLWLADQGRGPLQARLTAPPGWPGDGPEERLKGRADGPPGDLADGDAVVDGRAEAPGAARA